MNRPRVVRALRVTWTAFWGIAAVLLICLWVRSYFQTDIVRIRAQKFISSYLAGFGEIGIDVAINTSPGGFSFPGDSGKPVFIDSSAKMNSWEPDKGHPLMNLCGFRLQNYLLNTYNRRVFNFSLPFWFAFWACFAFAMLPWIRWSMHFSIRTMLVITTLFAIGVTFVVAFR
jgi:hypothetical protein